MLLAAATQDDGKKLLVIGLEAENMSMLQNDMPIYKKLEVNGEPIPGLEGWDIAVLGPEDLIRFIGHYGIKVNENNETG